MSKIKFIDLDKNTYVFETLEQLIDVLKDEDYDITLKVKKKGKLKHKNFKL